MSIMYSPHNNWFVFQCLILDFRIRIGIVSDFIFMKTLVDERICINKIIVFSSLFYKNFKLDGSIYLKPFNQV